MHAEYDQWDVTFYTFSSSYSAFAYVSIYPLGTALFLADTTMKLSFYLAALACLLPIGMMAQSKVSDPRTPYTWNKPLQVGGWIGFGPSIQTGLIVTDACNCEFDGGRGSSFSAGVSVEGQLAHQFVWGLGLEYTHNSFTAKYQETELVDIEKTASGTKAEIAVPFRHTAQLSASTFSLLPYVKWFPIGSKVFLRLGLNAGVLLSPSLSHTKELLQRTTVLSSGEIVRISLDPALDPRVISEDKAIIQQGDLINPVAFQFGLQPGAGAEFRIGKKVFLGPTITYLLPFTQYSSYSGSTFKVANLHVMGELRISLE
jgi:hypothetical protein